MASAWFYLSFAKPNLIVNTDLLIILCNYFSLILKAEILFPPQLYLKRFILYGQSLSVTDNNLTCQIDKNLQAVQQLNCLSETLLTLRV